MNKKRFPDFKGMMAVYHRAGMKVATNVKPCALLEILLFHFLLKSDTG